MKRLLQLVAMPALLVAGIALAVAAGAVPPGPMTFVVQPPEVAAAWKNVHDYQGRPLCQGCHVKADMGYVAGPIELCTRCHPEHPGSHPVGVVQRNPPEVGLPLEKGGVVVCHTCHESHDVTKSPAGLRLAFNDLCLRCHPAH